MGRSEKEARQYIPDLNIEREGWVREGIQMQGDRCGDEGGEGGGRWKIIDKKVKQ